MHIFIYGTKINVFDTDITAEVKTERIGFMENTFKANLSSVRQSLYKNKKLFFYFLTISKLIRLNVKQMMKSR